MISSKTSIVPRHRETRRTVTREEVLVHILSQSLDLGM